MKIFYNDKVLTKFLWFLILSFKSKVSDFGFFNDNNNDFSLIFLSLSFNFL